jgi:dihydroflavonol-4-reductase/farnesol dehydrogenase
VRRIAITGGAGFVGRAVVRALRDRGDAVVALVRDPGRAAPLAGMSAELVVDDLSDLGRLTERLRGVDGLIHAAGSYRIGIPAAERAAMWEANVGTTTRVLDAAAAAAVPRIVYVSTVNVFGNTGGQVVDETYRRDLGEGFLSWYDETKYRAHEVAEERTAGGAPIVIVMPSQVYGPADNTAVGEQLRLANAGRLRYRAVDGVRLGFIHVDDLAAGIVAALDRGRPGESYVLSGPHATLGEAIAIASRLGGHAAPRLRLPDGLVRAMAPFGRLIGQPNPAEIVSASAGVTYLASSGKAEAELGFTTRGIESGLRDTFGAGANPAS